MFTERSSGWHYLAALLRAGCVCARFFGLLFTVSASVSFGQRMAGTYGDLQAFLQGCPQNDVYYHVIRQDFQVLRDGRPSAEVVCTEPYTKMPAERVTEELSILQALRFAYYMDMGRAAYLPWTDLRLYDWLKSRIAGFYIDTSLSPGSVAASCCRLITGQRFVTLSPILNDLSRVYRLTPGGLAAQIALFAHEVRHSEGSGYAHVSCCGIPGGCDQTYNETDLSAYGIQYYLFTQWLTGGINLGYSCDANQRTQLANAFLGDANVYPSRFCDQKPPVLSMPQTPGGACISACTLTTSATPNDTIGGAGGTIKVAITASTPACGWAAASAANWMSVASGANSSGNGGAAYRVDANPGATRAGVIVSAGTRTTITQGAAGTPAPR